MTEEEVQELVDEVDEDGSGEIEFDEFLVLMSRQILNSDVVYDCEKAFDIWDGDHDGRITVEQVRSVFQRLPERPTVDEIEEFAKRELLAVGHDKPVDETRECVHQYGLDDRAG